MKSLSSGSTSSAASSPASAEGMDSGITLWQFLLELLLSEKYGQLISWTSTNGEFKLLDAEAVAKLWGLRKNKTNMNYDKLSRALRYYYDKNIIKKVLGQKFVYRFVAFPGGTRLQNKLPLKLKVSVNRSLALRASQIGGKSIENESWETVKGNSSGITKPSLDCAKSNFNHSIQQTTAADYSSKDNKNPSRTPFSSYKKTKSVKNYISEPPTLPAVTTSASSSWLQLQPCLLPLPTATLMPAPASSSPSSSPGSSVTSFPTSPVDPIVPPLSIGHQQKALAEEHAHYFNQHFWLTLATGRFPVVTPADFANFLSSAKSNSLLTSLFIQNSATPTTISHNNDNYDAFQFRNGATMSDNRDDNSSSSKRVSSDSL